MYPDRGKGIKRQRKKHKDHSCASREISCPSRNQVWRCQYRTERPNDNSTLVYGFLARQDIIIKSQVLCWNSGDLRWHSLIIACHPICVRFYHQEQLLPALQGRPPDAGAEYHRVAQGNRLHDHQGDKPAEGFRHHAERPKVDIDNRIPGADEKPEDPPFWPRCVTTWQRYI